MGAVMRGEVLAQLTAMMLLQIFAAYVYAPY